MSLLLEIPYAGASCDYLYARIRCRRADLSTGGLLRRARTGNPQQALLAEYHWLYRQLDRRLRRRLLPIFEYFELRLLVVALRFLAAGDHSSLKTQLQKSLFQTKVRSILQTAEQVAAGISGLEQLLVETYPVFRNLTEVYLRQGPGGFEQALLGGHLQDALKRCKSCQVRRFLLYLLDMRNLQAVQKHLRWQVPLKPPLLAGGSLDLIKCEKIWKSGDHAALHLLMQKFTRQSTRPADQSIEDYLLQGLTTRLQREGREPLQLGLVIDYLWRCQLAAREQGLQLFAEGSSAGKTAGTVGR